MTIKRNILLIILSFVLSACGSSSDTEDAKQLITTKQKIAAEVSNNTTKNQNLSLSLFLVASNKAFQDLSHSSQSLSLAVSSFLSQPSGKHLDALKDTLLNIHQQFIMTLVFQNINLSHPKFDTKQNKPTVIHPLNIRLDQFPIIPGYLDAVPNYPSSGLVFSEHELSLEFLNNEHQFTDEAYVALGFHALELMLTGGLNQNSAERSLLFSNLDDMENDVISPQYQRSRYIHLLAEQIDEDLQSLSFAWHVNGFYPSALLALPENESENVIQQALRMEEHALLSAENSNHAEEIEKRKKQLNAILSK